MKVDTHRQSGVTIIAPHDALTESSCPELQAALASEGLATDARVVVDMSQVPFVDSAGIEFLLRLAGNVEAGALRPRVVALTETVREALDLTQVLKRFFIFDSVEAAVRSYV
jgi:anti-anti-sigma factor